MTEAEWLKCTDPTPMLEFLRGKASDRKLRLFGVACCRRIWHELPNCVMTHTKPEQGYRAVQAAERYADGKATEEELGSCLVEPPCIYAAPVAFFGTAEIPLDISDVVNSAADAVAGNNQEAYSLEEQQQATLLRDIFGTLPFRQFRIDPNWLAWNEGLVKSLAAKAYEDRSLPSGTLDKDRLAVLADALEEAACDNADILNHCRLPGEHVRGCWLLDLLLEKEYLPGMTFLPRG